MLTVQIRKNHTDSPRSLPVALLDRAKGCFTGLAVGDALGTTVTMLPRDSFEPITDITGGGPFKLAPGYWTDDTSMALCIADSLLACSDFSSTDLADRFLRWVEEGYNSSTGKCFDIGKGTLRALAHYKKTGDIKSGLNFPDSMGNGTIMRLSPVAIYYMHDEKKALQVAEEQALITHGAAMCLKATRDFCQILIRLLHGKTKAESLPVSLPTARAAVKSSGFVLDTLEAAAWSFMTTDSFEDAVLTAANLGGDADTVAAVTGQLAGAYYGFSAIPQKWKNILHRGADIESLTERLCYSSYAAA